MVTSSVPSKRYPNVSRFSNLTQKKNHSYAPGVVPQAEAAKEGYSQNLWLLGPEHALTEVGTMNLFVALKKADGCKSLIIIFMLWNRNQNTENEHF